MPLRIPVNYQTTLYNPIYGQWGVPAQFFVQGELPAIALIVIDKTAGVPIVDETTTVESIRPAARVRARQLAGLGLSRDDLPAGRIEFNNGCWKVMAARPMPSPNGEADGEYLLLLTGA